MHPSPVYCKGQVVMVRGEKVRGLRKDTVGLVLRARLINGSVWYRVYVLWLLREKWIPEIYLSPFVRYGIGCEDQVL